MKIKFLAGCLMAAVSLSALAQQSYMVDGKAAVFYPEKFDAQQHLPSPVFVRELTPTGTVSVSWQLRPQFLHEQGHSVVQFSVGEGVDLYGAGEMYGDLRHNGITEGFWNKDNGAFLADGGKRMYQTHPFVLGVRKDGSAFGIIADNTWKSTLKMGAVIKFESEGPTFRVVVIEGKTPDDVLTELGKLSGTIELPPLWALGYQQSRFSYTPATRAMEVADEFRKRNIPCDVIWMDINYMDGFRIFTFSPNDVPNPKAFTDYLHKKHFKSVFMIDPGVKVEKGYFVDDQGTANNYWVQTADGKPFVGKVWPGECHFPDFTRPEVRHWWSGLYKNFMAQGVDGVWNDMNEPSVFGGPDGSMPADNVHLGGEGLTPGSHLRYHNVFGYNMVKATREGILAANPDKRPFVLSRSNFLGGQRYAATWTGDNVSAWEHMEKSIPMSLNMGLSGQPFNGPDIGGFLGNCNAELLAHWTVIGVYFPFVRNHCVMGAANQEPWAFGPKVEAVCRTAINRRYRLLPYIYTLFREANETGLPVMRPVLMADVKDTALRTEQQAFLLGGDVLVVPRWAKNVHLPKGDWDLFRFESKDDGYQPFLALRSGSIIPVSNVIQNTDEYSTDSLTFLVNPTIEGVAQGKFYADAGNGFGYRNGDYAQFELKASTMNGKITLQINQTAGQRKETVKFIRLGIVCNGKITYSDWTKDTKVILKAVNDKENGLDVKRLKWAHVDMTKQPKLAEQL